MGGGASRSAAHLLHLGKSEDEAIKLMMPLYYDQADITPEKLKLASDCWKLIVSDLVPGFFAIKGTPECHYQSCVVYFYDTFYARLFDSLPTCKDLFRSGMKNQGKMLVMMISLALNEMKGQPGHFEKTLVKLTEIHYHRGVKAVEYAIMGDVLFWTLRKVMGDLYYTKPLHLAWVTVYSRMLRTIIPHAVRLEMGEKSIDVLNREFISMFHASEVIHVNDLAEDNLTSQAMVDRGQCKTAAVTPVAGAGGKLAAISE